VSAGDLNWNQPVVVTLASLLLMGGIAFRAFAVRTLGRYFTNDLAVSADQPVIQDGPYRLIRHPAYTGTLLSAVGAGLGMTNWLSLIAVVAGFLIGHLYRVGIEEREMTASIGEPYAAYMRRTKRFIPFLF
jgi:protein-S-isoprenylcysteine O-methyltransferase